MQRHIYFYRINIEVEIWSGVTTAGQTRKDMATQPINHGRMRRANVFLNIVDKFFLHVRSPQVATLLLPEFEIRAEICRLNVKQQFKYLVRTFAGL